MSNLFKCFCMSKKTELILRDEIQSKASNISCVIASNWFMHESDGWNRDSFVFSIFFPLIESFWR